MNYPFENLFCRMTALIAQILVNLFCNLSKDYLNSYLPAMVHFLLIIIT